MRLNTLLFCLAVIAVISFVILFRNNDSKQIAVKPSDLQLGPIRHDSLSAELDARVQRFESIFADVYPQTHQEWIDGFRRDLNPESEIAVWESIADAYHAFLQKHELSTAARKEAFGLLLVRSSADEQSTLSGAKLKHLSKPEAEELVRLYNVTPTPIQFTKSK